MDAVYAETVNSIVDMCLVVLQNLKPLIENVLLQAAFVAVYVFRLWKIFSFIATGELEQETK